MVMRSSELIKEQLVLGLHTIAFLVIESLPREIAGRILPVTAVLRSTIWMTIDVQFAHEPLLKRRGRRSL